MDRKLDENSLSQVHINPRFDCDSSLLMAFFTVAGACLLPSAFPACVPASMTNFPLRACPGITICRTTTAHLNVRDTMGSHRQSSMDDYVTLKKRNVAAWQLKPKQRPLVVSNAPYTSPPKDHVLVQVYDVAINPIDWILQEQDLFKLKYPAILGDDIAGEIVELGEGVDDFHTGQRVIAYVHI
jgi:hypothetical protein